MSKLVLSTKEQQLREAEAMTLELKNSLAALNDAKRELHKATWAFTRALDRLNTVNAHLGCGPVDIEDELFHHCLPQETFNQRYADENARHNAKLDASRQIINDLDQQK